RPPGRSSGGVFPFVGPLVIPRAQGRPDSIYPRVSNTVDATTGREVQLEEHYNSLFSPRDVDQLSILPFLHDDGGGTGSIHHRYARTYAVKVHQAIFGCHWNWRRPNLSGSAADGTAASRIFWRFKSG